MKVLKILTVGVILLMAIAAAGQQAASTANPSIDDDVALLRQDVQAQKTDVITKTMNFTDAQSKAFWPVYREYAHEQQVIGDQRVSLIKDYAQEYDTIDDAKADAFMQRAMKFDQDNQDLRRKYYPMFKKAIGAKQAVKFFQVDNRLSMLINLQLASMIPIMK